MNKKFCLCLRLITVGEMIMGAPSKQHLRNIDCFILYFTYFFSEIYEGIRSFFTIVIKNVSSFISYKQNNPWIIALSFIVHSFINPNILKLYI